MNLAIAIYEKNCWRFLPLTLFRWSDVGSASTGSLRGAKPETHFQTWSISAVANLQIITVVKAISVPTENGKKVLTIAKLIYLLAWILADWVIALIPFAIFASGREEVACVILILLYSAGTCFIANKITWFIAAKTRSFIIDEEDDSDD